MNFKYYKGAQNSPETIELNITKSDGTYITTCVINVDLLLCGIQTFPCGNGDDYKLEKGWYMEALRFLRTERARLLEGETIKSLDGWRGSGLRKFDEYCFPGDEVTKGIVEHFINSVPPILLRSNCTQAGEAYSHEPDEKRNLCRPTYATFHRISDEKWVFDGYCFKGENINRVALKNRVDELIEKEVERSNAEVRLSQQRQREREAKSNEN